MFSKTPTTYDNDIALLGAVLSRSAYSSSSIKTNLETLGFQDIELYNYNDYELTKCDTNEKKPCDLHDTVGYAFGHKEVTVQNESFTLFVVVVRGTDGKLFIGEDWKSNLNCNMTTKQYSYGDAYCPGFDDAENKLFSKLEGYISKYKTSKNKIFVTGHSRGAAVANLLAEDLNRTVIPESDRYIYTFATPNPVSDNKAKEKNHVFNIVNPKDPVSGTPNYMWKFGNTLVFPSEEKVAGKNVYENMYKKTLESNLKSLFGLTIDYNESCLMSNPKCHNMEVYIARLNTTPPTHREVSKGKYQSISTTQTKPTPINGKCGSLNGTTVATKPSMFSDADKKKLCENGTVYSVDDKSFGWEWACFGINGGNDQFACKANKAPTQPTLTPINGKCGSLNGTTVATKPSMSSDANKKKLCENGTVYSVDDKSFGWEWACFGINGGNDQFACKANKSKINGKCGSLNGTTVATKPSMSSDADKKKLCENGTIYSVDDKSFGWEWACFGINGGSDQFACKVNKAK
jgi:hypothetical protein